MPDQLTWFDVPPPEADPKPRRQYPRASHPNPMLVVWGPGPDGARCGSCRHFERWGYAKVVRKCRKRGVTHGEATDHFATWPACRWYEGEDN